MRVGVSTIPSRHRCCAAHVDRYLGKILSVLKERQQDVKITVFTDGAEQGGYGGFDCVPIAASGGGISRFSGGSPLDKAVNESNIDVLFAPLEAPSAQAAVPQVLYAVDFSLWQEEGRRGGRKRGPDMKLLKQACGKASAIVVPSEYLWRKCFDIFDAPLDKISVAPPGVDTVFGDSVEPIVAKPYIVLISDSLTAEVIPKVLQTFREREDEFYHTLVVVGRRCSHEPEDWGPRVVRFEECPDTCLASLYQHCAAFLYPAEFDGSSIRLLEGLQAGAPVVAANSGSEPSVGGNAPIFFNPASMGSLLQALRRVLHEDAEAREPRVREGKRIAGQHSWEKCTWKVLAALRKF